MCVFIRHCSKLEYKRAYVFIFIDLETLRSKDVELASKL